VTQGPYAPGTYTWSVSTYSPGCVGQAESGGGGGPSSAVGHCTRWG
jgi:hypothetical protein